VSCALFSHVGELHNAPTPSVEVSDAISNGSMLRSYGMYASHVLHSIQHLGSWS
jgi:hypothetical protein